MDEESKEEYFLIRPHAKEFLNEISNLFHVVIYTTENRAFVEAILAILDPFNSVEFSIYREAID